MRGAATCPRRRQGDPEQPRWAPWSSAAWRAQAGTVVRLQPEARREGYELWTLICEIDLASESPTVEVP